MLKCKNCGRENDDSFSFCLDCGTPLKQTAAPASVSVQRAQPSRVEVSQATQAAEEKMPKAQSAACPSCGAAVGAQDAFCASCGFRLGKAGEKRTMFMHTAGPVAVPKPSARLVLILPDGSEGTVYSLKEGTTTIGRSMGEIQFPNDPYLAPRHAKIAVEKQNVFVEDLGSLNGVFIRIQNEMAVEPGASFRIGQQLLRLELPGEFQAMPLNPAPGDDSRFWGSPPPQVWARLVQIIEGGKIGEVHLLILPEVILGREIGDIRFPDDGFVSAKHCSLSNRNGNCYLRDLGSSNGTFLRLHAPQKLAAGDKIQVGSQVLKLELS